MTRNVRAERVGDESSNKEFLSGSRGVSYTTSTVSARAKRGLEAGPAIADDVSVVRR